MDGLVGGGWSGDCLPEMHVQSLVMMCWLGIVTIIIIININGESIIPFPMEDPPNQQPMVHMDPL